MLVEGMSDYWCGERGGGGAGGQVEDVACDRLGCTGRVGLRGLWLGGGLLRWQGRGVGGGR